MIISYFSGWHRNSHSWIANLLLSLLYLQNKIHLQNTKFMSSIMVSFTRCKKQLGKYNLIHLAIPSSKIALRRQLTTLVAYIVAHFFDKFKKPYVNLDEGRFIIMYNMPNGGRYCYYPDKQQNLSTAAADCISSASCGKIFFQNFFKYILISMSKGL